jgi:hypothetical protein
MEELRFRDQFALFKKVESDAVEMFENEKVLDFDYYFNKFLF